MTKPLDPEIKVLRAVNRALDTLPPEAMQRALEWVVASRCQLPGIRLPDVPRKDEGQGDEAELDYAEMLA